MEMVMRLAAVALCGAMLATILKQYAPAFAVTAALVCGVLVLSCVLTPMGEIFNTLSVFLAAAGVDGEVYLPVIKAVGIAVVVRIASEICRDSGQGALGSKLELAGTVAAIAVCIPLMQQVFTLLSDMMGT